MVLINKNKALSFKIYYWNLNKAVRQDIIYKRIIQCLLLSSFLLLPHLVPLFF